MEAEALVDSRYVESTLRRGVAQNFESASGAGRYKGNRVEGLK